MNYYYVKSLVLLLFIFAFSGCKGTKELAYSPAGTWEYEITGIPDGDQAGTLTLMKSGDGYSGTLVTDAGSVDLKDVVVENNVLTTTFSVQGFDVNMKGNFEGEKFSGQVAAGGYEFPITATRKL